jgi:hypothetical protein
VLSGQQSRAILTATANRALAAKRLFDAQLIRMISSTHLHWQRKQFLERLIRALLFSLPQQLRQVGDARRDPSCGIAGQ